MSEVEVPINWASTNLETIVSIRDKERVPVNSRERQQRIEGKKDGELYPYYGATGQVGWIDDYIFDEELVLLGEDGAPFLDSGREVAYLISGKSWVNNHAHVLEAIPGASSNRYLLHYLNAFDYHGYVTGTTRLKLTQGSLRSLKFLLPPLAEQRRIVDKIEELFSDLDAGVAALETAQRQLKRYRQSVLKAAVEGQLTALWREEHGPAAEPADQLLQRILEERRARWEADQWAKEIDRAKQKAAKAARKAAGRPLQRGEKLRPDEWQDLTEAEYQRYLPKGDKWKAKYKEPTIPATSDLHELPQGWVWATVEQLGNVQLGRQRSPKHHQGANMRPYLRVANVFEDRIDTTDVKEMNFTPSEFKIYQLKYGDILLNEGQSLELVGRPAMYRDEVPGACFQNTLVRFRVYSAMNRALALIVFRAYLHTGRFQKIAGWTTSIAHLGAGRFAKLDFPLPSLAEQQAIVEEVERLLSIADAAEQTIAHELKRAERLRQSILKQAFAGKLVPQDPGDEPASVLLERIRSEKAARKGKGKRKAEKPVADGTVREEAAAYGKAGEQLRINF